MMELAGAYWEDGFATFVHGFMEVTVNDTIRVADVDPDGWNGDFEVVMCTGTSCRVVMADDPGAWVSGGTVEVI